MPCPSSIRQRQIFDQIDIIDIIEHHQPMVLLLKFVDYISANDFNLRIIVKE